MVTPEQLRTLAAVCPAASAMPEAGIDYVFLPGLKFTVGGKERTVDALLCPAQSGGYSTRLFLAEPVPERGQNWTSHVICGRTWQTWSWNNVPANLTLPQILLAHLVALR
jgi:hypothetical protein